MKIPRATQRPRFYVATSDTHAFSSWNQLDEADCSFMRLATVYPEDARKVIGIIETGPDGHTRHPRRCG